MAETQRMGRVWTAGLGYILAVSLVTPAAFGQTGEAPPPPPPPSSAGQPQGGPGGYGGPHRGGPDQRAEMLQRHLGLSPQQYTQVKALLEGERQQMEALHSNGGLSHEQMHTQMRGIHDDTDARVKALLSPGQLSQYNTMEARMQQRRTERGEGEAGQGMPGQGVDAPPSPPPPPAGAPQS